MRLIEFTFHEPKIYIYLEEILKKYTEKPFSEFITGKKHIYVLKDAYLYHFDDVVSVVDNNKCLYKIIIFEKNKIRIINTMKASKWLNKLISRYITCVHNMYVQYKDSGNITVHNLQDKSVYDILAKLFGE